MVSISLKKVPLNASLIASSNPWLKQCISVSQGESSQILVPRPLCIPVFTLALFIFKPWSRFPKFKIPIHSKDSFGDDKNPSVSALLMLLMLKNLTCRVPRFRNDFPRLLYRELPF